MFNRHRHADDDRLLEAYFGDGDGPVAPPSTVAACPVCRDRYARLARALDATRHDAAADAAVFTPERLAHQREQIARRLDIALRPSRILRFPASGRTAPSSEHHARRWVAAAAAAGLFIGLVVGQVMDIGSRLNDAEVATRSAARTAPPSAVAALRTADWTAEPDEALLVEIDAALVAPRMPELRPLDHFTPRITEVALAAGR